MVIKATTKAESIYADLKGKILSGHYSPNYRLIIRQLAIEYGTSEIPVREALKELAAEDLVETKPHIGSTVKGFSANNIKDMLEMREFLEPIAANLAVKKANNKDIKHLESIYKLSATAFENNDIKSYSKYNQEFHDYIIQMSKNIYLIKIITDLKNIEKRMRQVFELFPEILQDSLKEHYEFIQLIKDRKNEEAGIFMLKHKKRSFEKIKKYFGVDTIIE